MVPKNGWAASRPRGCGKEGQESQGLSKGLRLSVTGRASWGELVAMVMDQPKKGSGSKLLDKLVLKSEYYQILKK